MSLADQYKESRERNITLAGIKFHICQPDIRRILTKHDLKSTALRAFKQTEVTGEDDAARAVAHHADLVDLNKAVLDDCCAQVTLDRDEVSDTVMHANDLGAHDREALAELAWGLWGLTLSEVTHLASFPDARNAGEESEPVGDTSESTDN